MQWTSGGLLVVGMMNDGVLDVGVDVDVDVDGIR
jgi:hypothetical protein